MRLPCAPALCDEAPSCSMRSAPPPSASRPAARAAAPCGRRGLAPRRASRCVAAIFVPPTTGSAPFHSAPPGAPSASQLRATVEAIAAPVRADMQLLEANIMDIVGGRHALLAAAAEHIFTGGAKKLRPMLCLLVGRATAQACGLSDLTREHRALAEITEMIHTASLLHDDVLDDCDLRRGKRTVNTVFGTRVAVLVGDYLFAQSSNNLANLDNLEVIKLISKVIADFANGEVSQMGNLFNAETTLEAYMDKSFYKTATLIAASCRSEAVFSGADEALKADMYAYGRHLGLAFQVVDDILDFTQTAEQLGKPQGQDLASGNLTAPAIYALAAGGAHAPRAARLRELIDEEFQGEGQLEEALSLVEQCGGLTAARALARAEGDAALAALHRLPQGEAKRSLEAMVDYILERVY